MQPMISCELRNDLMERHRRAMIDYKTAVALMENLFGFAEFKEFKEATERAEAAQARYRQIRNELTKHFEEHGC